MCPARKSWLGHQFVGRQRTRRIGNRLRVLLLALAAVGPLAAFQILQFELFKDTAAARDSSAIVAAAISIATVCGFVAALVLMGGRRFFTDLIQEKTKLLEATLDNMNQGLIVVDSKGTVPICNRQAIKLLDLPEDLVNSHPHVDQVIAFQKQRGEFVGIPEDIQIRLHPKVHGETENVYERRRPNGTVLEIRTVPFSEGGVVRTYTDITYRRKIEEKLEAREKLYRLVTDNATDLIVRLDLAGKLIYVSPSSRTVLGYAPEEMIGTPFTNYVHPDDVKPTTRAFKNLISDNPSLRAKIEYRARRKDGTWVWLEANPTLIRDEAGAPLGFVDVVRDITARRAAEEEAARARQQTEEAMAAQGQFLASMSHELRTPLNSILGFTNLILERRDIYPDIRRQIGLIRTASSSLLTVVNDVLDFSQLDEGKLSLVPVKFSVAGLIDDSVAIVRELATKKRLDLRVVYDPTAPTHVIGDDTRLRQVLLNLLNNAVKFTRVGRVTLRVEHLGSTQTGASLRFSVIDTGIGIPEEKLDRLFKRFSQVDGSTSREFGGSGLGLAICKRLIELMGGEIGVKSAAGQGSTFWFTVHLAVAQGDVLPREPDIEPPIFAGSARILLAEDVDVNQEIVVSMLKSFSQEVDVVSDGHGALEAVAANRYEVVLMDIQMPGMDGVEATKRIRALAGQAGKVPIIAMTANALPYQVKAFRDAGMNDYLGKPFTREDLLATIGRCLGAKADPEPAKSASDKTEAEVLDRVIYDTLVALLGKDKADVLLEKLLRELQSGFDLAGASQDSHVSLARKAHRLVSSAGMLGFASLAQSCSAFEAAVGAERGVEPAFETMRNAVTLAMAEIIARLGPRPDVRRSA
jgi:PAS domain S-box-containing protein